MYKCHFIKLLRVTKIYMCIVITLFCLHVHTHNKKVVLVSLAKYYSYFDSLNGNGDVSQC